MMDQKIKKCKQRKGGKEEGKQGGSEGKREKKPWKLERGWHIRTHF